MVDDTLVYPLLTSVLDCLCAELATSEAGSPCWCGVVNGTLVPMDHCDCNAPTGCGKAFVRLDSIFPTDPFPRQAITTQTCAGTVFGVRLQVGVFRCVPDMDAHGNPPTVLQDLEAARILMSDQAAILRAILCCDLGGLVSDKNGRLLGAYTPVLSGACGGGSWTITYRRSA